MPLNLSKLRLNPVFLYIFSVLLFVILWWVGSLVVSKRVLPSPVIVGKVVGELLYEGEVGKHLFITLFRVFAGFFLAEMLGIIFGVVMGLKDFLEKIGDVWVMILITVPGMAYGIFALLAFGLTVTAMIIAIGLTTLPYVTVNIWAGVRNIDKSLLDMSKAFRVKKGNILRKVVFPQIVPFILSSSRYGIGLAWKVAVVIEMLGASKGVGYMLNYSFGLFSMEHVLAWVVIIVAVMLFVELVLIRSVEERVLAWRPKVAL